MPGTDIKDALGLNEIILDVSITANRPDCQSIYGLAREIGAMLGRKVRPLNLSYRVKRTDRAPISVEIEDFSLCSRYSGRIVENIKLRESPEWLKKRLRLMGLRPINNVVDVTNYVLLEVGQPLHAFDIRQIDERIVVRRAHAGEWIKLLDGSDYTLTDSMLVIADAAKPLALAGVMGGEYSGISADTQTVFLESARFARGSIRSTARALGLKSDSSARFEKGVDFVSVDIGRKRALALFCELNAGDILDIPCGCSAPLPKNKVIKTSAAQLSGVLGIEVPADKITEILSVLGIKTTVTGGAISAVIPLFREDIDAFPDLAEEVIRFYGYDKLRAAMFDSGKASVGGYSCRDRQIQTVKSMMVGFGAHEILTYSFVNQKQYDKLNIPKNDKLRDTIQIMNPLSEDFAVMRTELAGGMLNAVKLNVSRKNEEFRLFEVGRAYKAEVLPLAKLPDESEALCIAYLGRGENFYTLKSAVTEILSAYRTAYKLEYTDCPYLHPGIGAKIVTEGGVVGNFGRIHPVVAKNFEVPDSLFLAEICLESLITSTMSNIRHKNLPKFPSVRRDLAIIVKDEYAVGELADCVREAAVNLCEHVELFDIYKGAQIEAGHKSVAFSMRLRAEDKTLDEAQIQHTMSKITAALDERFGAKLRV